MGLYQKKSGILTAIIWVNYNEHIEMSVDNAMSKSMQQYQSVMDDKFQEIKNLFLSNKRSAPADESAMHD